MIEVNKFIGWYSQDPSSRATTMRELVILMNHIFEDYRGPIFSTAVYSDYYNEEGIVFTNSIITEQEAEKYYESVLKEEYPDDDDEEEDEDEA